MTKRDLSKLEALLDDPNIKGKKLIRQLIWLNTVKPKCKIGECYEITDPSRRIYGVQIKNFHAQVVDINYNYQEKYIQYEMSLKVINSDKEYNTDAYVLEAEIGKKVKDNVTVINGKDTWEDCISI